MNMIKQLHSTIIMIAACLAFIVSTLVAHAQDISDEQMEAAKELVEILKVDKAHEPVLEALSNDTITLFTQSNQDISADIEDAVKKASEKLAETRAPVLTEEIVRSYASNFSTEELNNIVEFYKTETGQKLIETQTKLEGAILEATLTWGDLISEEIVQMVRADLKERGHNL